MISLVLLSNLERVPLGARSFSPNLFGLDDLAGASLIAGGVSAIGSLFGQNSANKTNMKINQQNIDFQREQFEKEKAYNTEMWNKTNEYNDPSAQVERLKAAGINPSMAMGTMSSGSATAMSSPSPSVPSSIPVNPIGFEQVGQAFQNYLQAKSASANINNQVKQGNVYDAQARKTNADAATSEANAAVAQEEAKYRIYNLVEDMQGKQVARQLQQQHLPFEFGLASAQKTQAEQGVDMNRLTIDSMQLQNDMTRLQLRYLPKEQELQLASLKQSIATALSQQYLNQQQAQTVAQQGVLLAYQAAGQKIENGKAISLGREMVRQAQEQTKQQHLQTGFLERKEKWDSYMDKYYDLPMFKRARIFKGATDFFNPLSGLTKFFK